VPDADRLGIGVSQKRPTIYSLNLPSPAQYFRFCSSGFGFFHIADAIVDNQKLVYLILFLRSRRLPFMRDTFARFQLRFLAMKAVAFALFFTASICVALAGDPIKYRSPDGKFAMLLSETDDEAGVTIKLVEVASGKVVIDLADTGHPYSENAKLLWSTNSKEFAFFEDDRRGGSTTVYRRSGDTFEDVSLPETPDCKNKQNVGKEFAVGVKPQRWINSNTLVLLASNEWSDSADPDKTHECKQTIQIVFDSAGKASAKLIKETHK
jgi:hypothetical protein